MSWFLALLACGTQTTWDSPGDVRCLEINGSEGVVHIVADCDDCERNRVFTCTTEVVGREIRVDATAEFRVTTCSNKGCGLHSETCTVSGVEPGTWTVTYGGESVERTSAEQCTDTGV